MAVRNRPYAIMEKFCSTTTETVTILEDINVESDELNREHHQIKEFALTKETDKVKVTITLKKRGAVKGIWYTVKQNLLTINQKVTPFLFM